MKNMLLMDGENDCHDKDQRAWSVKEIWSQFQKSVSEHEYPLLGKDYLLKMADMFVDSLHTLRIEKRTKLGENQRDIGEFMICGSCCDIYVQPVTLLCGHTYCKKCLEKREKQSYLELCLKCDKNSFKRARWCLFRRSLLEKYRNNVIVHTIVQENYPDELHAIALRLEGNGFFSAEEYQKAAEKYEEAIDTCPTSFMSWSNLSQLRSSQSLHAEALQAAQKSISICSYWAKGYYREGVAFKALSNNFAGAMSFFKYLILEPSSVSIKEKFIECVSEILESEAPPNSGRDERMNAIEGIMKAVLEKGFEFSLTNHPDSARFQQKLNSQFSIENLRNRFTCFLCCRVYYQATTTPCGHTYCTQCLERSLDYNSNCSICRAPISELITVKPKPIDRIVDALVRQCFPREYEESKQASINESAALKYESDEVMTIPVFVCIATFPTLECPLHIFEPRYKLMLRRCLDASEKVFGMCMFDEVNGFKEYGVLMEIRDCKLLDDGRMLVDTIGGKRFKVLERGTRDGYSTGRVKLVRDIPSQDTEELRALQKVVYEESQSLLSKIPNTFKHTVQLKYGPLPPMEEAGNVDEHGGPKWLWYMFRLLVQDGDEVEAALKCESMEQRLQLIKSSILRVQEFSMASNA